MGRSRPTFRNYLDRFEGDWQPYRRTLRRRDQAHFDRLFEEAREHADAAGQLDPTDPRLAILFSMLLAHERQLQAFQELRERLEGIERAGGARRERASGASDGGDELASERDSTEAPGASEWDGAGGRRDAGAGQG